MCPPSHYLSKDGQGLLVGTAHNCAHRPLGYRNRFTTLLKYVLRWELADLGYQVGGWGHVRVCQLSAAGHIR
eukprot:2069455-Pyramimonas_sp.AAC.1